MFITKLMFGNKSININRLISHTIFKLNHHYIYTIFEYSPFAYKRVAFKIFKLVN